MMKIKSLLIVTCCMLLSYSAMAQLNRVQFNNNGANVRFGVLVKGLGEVIVDVYGNVIRVVDRDDFSVESVDYEYYSSFNSYEAGKIKSIGDIKFTYYSNFNDYEAGKIKSIAGKTISYYSKFNDYEAGKIKSVDGVKVNYYSNFNDYEAGKIKSIAGHKYDYFSDFDNNVGRLKSGSVKVKANGIDFIVRGRR